MISCIISQIGLIVGDRMSHHLSQQAFEKLLVWLLAIVGLIILGLFEFQIEGIIGLACVIAAQVRQVVIARSKYQPLKDESTGSSVELQKVSDKA